MEEKKKKRVKNRVHPVTALMRLRIHKTATGPVDNATETAFDFFFNTNKRKKNKLKAKCA